MTSFSYRIRLSKECGAVLPLTAMAFVVLFVIVLMITQFLGAVEDSVRNLSNVTQTIIQMSHNLPNRKATFDGGLWSVLLNEDMKASIPAPDTYRNASKIPIQVHGEERILLTYVDGDTPKVNVRSSVKTTFLVDEFLGFLKIFDSAASLGGEPSQGALFFGFDNSFSMRGAPEDTSRPGNSVTTPIRRLLEAARIPVATRSEASHFCYPISMRQIEREMGRNLSFQEELEMCYYLAAQLPYAMSGRALPIGVTHWNSERSESLTYSGHSSLVGSFPTPAGCGCQNGSGAGCPPEELLKVWGYNPAVSLEGTYCEHLAANTITRVCGPLQFSIAPDQVLPAWINTPGWRTALFDHSTCPTTRVPIQDMPVPSAMCQPLMRGGSPIEITDGDICRLPFQHNPAFLTAAETQDISALTNSISSSIPGEVLLTGAPVSQMVLLTAHFSDFWMTAKQLAQGALVGLAERFPYLGFYVFSAPNPYGTFQERTPDGRPIRGVFEFHNWRDGNIYEKQLNLANDLLAYQMVDANGQLRNEMKNLGSIFQQVRLNEALSYLDHDEFPNLNPAPGTKPFLEPVYKYSTGHSLKARSYLNVIGSPLRPFPSRHGALSWSLESAGFHPSSLPFFPLAASGQLDLFYPPGQYGYFPSPRQSPQSTLTYNVHPSWNTLGNTSQPMYSFGNFRETNEVTGAQSGAPLQVPSAINNPVGAFAYLTPSLGGTNTHELFAQYADDCQAFREETNNERGFCTAFIITDGEPRTHGVQQAFNQLAARGGPALTAAPRMSFGRVDTPGTLMQAVNDELLRFEADGNTFVFLIFIQHQRTLSPEAEYFLSLFDPSDPKNINTNPDGRGLFQIDYENADDFREKMVSVLRLAIILLSNRSKLTAAES